MDIDQIDRNTSVVDTLYYKTPWKITSKTENKECNEFTFVNYS